MNESESRRLVEDGVISFEQAEGISGERHRLPDWAGARTVEWLGYVGAAAFLLATVVLTFDLMADNFSALEFFALGDVDNIPGGLVALVGGLVLLAVGWRLAKGTEGATRRAAGFVLLFGVFAAALGSQLLLLDLDINDFTPLVTVIPLVVFALFAWRTWPSLPTQLALFAMVVQVVTAFLVLFQAVDLIAPEEAVLAVALGGAPETAQGWLPLLVDLVLGLLWIAMGSAGTLRPRNTAFVIGGVYGWVATVTLYSTGDGWIIVSVLFTAVLIWMAVSRRSSVLGGVGAFSVLALVLQSMMLFTDDPGALDFELWYGIPSVVALGAALMLASRSGGAAKTAAAPAPAVSPSASSTADGT